MGTLSKFIVPGILLFLTLVFGVWLSLSGKPYNSVLFNVHKLIALGTVIFTAIPINQVLKNTNPQAFVIVLVVLAGICVVALFATGAIMSIGTPNYTLILTVHRTVIIMLVIVMTGAVALLTERIKL